MVEDAVPKEPPEDVSPWTSRLRGKNVCIRLAIDNGSIVSGKFLRIDSVLQHRYYLVLEHGPNNKTEINVDHIITVTEIK